MSEVPFVAGEKKIRLADDGAAEDRKVLRCEGNFDVKIWTGMVRIAAERA